MIQYDPICSYSSDSGSNRFQSYVARFLCRIVCYTFWSFCLPTSFGWFHLWHRKTLDSSLQDFHTTCYRTSALTWESSCASRAFSCSSWDGSNCRKMDEWWDRWYHRMHVLMPTLIFNSTKPTKLRGLQSCKVSCNVGILLQKLWDVVQFLVKQRLRLASDLGTGVTHDFRSNDVVAELTGDEV